MPGTGVEDCRPAKNIISIFHLKTVYRLSMEFRKELDLSIPSYQSSFEVHIECSFVIGLKHHSKLIICNPRKGSIVFQCELHNYSFFQNLIHSKYHHFLRPARIANYRKACASFPECPT